MSSETLGRRTGDAHAIPGDYQFRASRSCYAVQRFWHFSKRQAISLLLPPAIGDRVMDIGCGSGVISDFLAASGASVCGLDGNPDAIAFAERTFNREHLTFRRGLIDEAFESDGLLDKVYVLEVIEHLYVHQAAALLRRITALLRPGGRVLLTSPNGRSPWPLIEWGIDRLRLAPRMAGDQHVVRYGRTDLRRLCEEAGFDVETLCTGCFLAPWLAPLNWDWATRVGRAEYLSNCPWGAILVAVLCRP